MELNTKKLDQLDDEIKKENRVHVGFVINVRRMNNLVDQIVDETGEYDEKYPKHELIKIWTCIMLFMQVLFVLSVNALIIVTIPVMLFYAFTLFQIFKAFKRFKYKRVWLIILTVLVLAAEVAIAVILQRLIFG